MRYEWVYGRLVWREPGDENLHVEVAVTGYSRDWIQKLARRYNEDGLRSLGDRRHRNPGARDRALLGEEEDQRKLSRALEDPPEDGGMWNHWLILPKVNVEVFPLALEHFAREVGAGTRKRILLVLDRAGWHTGKKLKVLEGIHSEFLPSRSPALRAAERLRYLSNEGAANRYFEEVEDLEEALVELCVSLSEQAELVGSYTRYRWWPKAA